MMFDILPDPNHRLRDPTNSRREEVPQRDPSQHLPFRRCISSLDVGFIDATQNIQLMTTRQAKNNKPWCVQRADRIGFYSKNDENSRVVQLHPQGPLYCAVINRDGNHLIPMTQIEGGPLQNQLSSMFENVQRGHHRALRGFDATTEAADGKNIPIRINGFANLRNIEPQCIFTYSYDVHG